MDLSRVFLNGLPPPTVLYTQSMTAYWWCIMQRMYTQSFRCRLVIQNMGKRKKMLLFFYTQRKNLPLGMFVMLPLCARTAWPGSRLSARDLSSARTSPLYHNCSHIHPSPNCTSLASVEDRGELSGVAFVIRVKSHLYISMHVKLNADRWKKSSNKRFFLKSERKVKKVVNPHTMPALHLWNISFFQS